MEQPAPLAQTGPATLCPALPSASHRDIRAADHLHPRCEQDLRLRRPGAEADQSGHHEGRDLRAARTQRRRQDHADQHDLRHRQSVLGGTITADGHDIIRDYKQARKKIGLVPQELHTDAFERVIDTVNFSRGLFGFAADAGLHREGAARSLALGQAQRQDHGAVRRHEAPRHDRQGAEPRAEDPVPRRAQRRRRCRTAARHVGDGARPARRTASPSS